MSTAREPRSEELYQVMRGSDPEAATRAFQKFLITPGKWWNGDNPLTWAHAVAEKHVAHLDRLKWPVHKLGGSDWVAVDALILLGRDAPMVDCPPAFLRRVICNSIDWEIAGLGRKGEPWGHEPEEVLEWKSAPHPGSESRRMWQSKRFCRLVATAINALTDTLRPYAILNLLDGQRPVDIARTLNVDEAKARKYVCRALQALVGRRDAKQLLKKANSRLIRNALAEPEDAKVDGMAKLVELIHKRRAAESVAPVDESTCVDPGHDFMPHSPTELNDQLEVGETPPLYTPEDYTSDESEAG